MSRPFECRWTEFETIDEFAFKRRAPWGSKTSALRPTSCTGQLVPRNCEAAWSASAAVAFSGRTTVLQIMWWKMKRPPTVVRPVFWPLASRTSLISRTSTAAT